jgi:hypothetical protein
MADILSPALLSGEFRVLRSVAQSKSSVDIYLTSRETFVKAAVTNKRIFKFFCSVWSTNAQ